MVSVVAERWLADVDKSDKAMRTKQVYHHTWTKYLAERVGSLRLGELGVQTADRVLRGLLDNIGPGPAKHSRVVLSGVMGYAVRLDVIDSNPVSAVGPLGSNKRKSPSDARAAILREGGMARLRAHGWSSPGCRWTGCRIWRLLRHSPVWTDDPP